MNAPPEVSISLSGITKRFPGVVANDDISLTFNRGEVHALLGENGAGKSTLIGILAGMQQPDAGEIRVGGKAVRVTSPRVALELGIGTVYQHVLLIPSLTVLENLMLGAPWWRRCERARTLARFEELRGLLSTNVDPDALVGRLSLGQQQQVEIMRALWHGELMLVLDEPTSMLTPQGVRELAAVVKRLREHGISIVFITHKLREAYELADRVTVLRLGRVVGEIDREQLARMSEQEVIDRVVSMMFAREQSARGIEHVLVGDVAERREPAAFAREGAPSVVLRGVSTHGTHGECPLVGASLEVWPGEILGIAGVDGNGQQHLAEFLAGQRAASAGTLELDGTDVTALNVARRRECGVRYITDDRVGEGTAAEHSVATNILAKEIGRPPFWRNGLTHWAGIHRHAREQIAHYDIRTPSERVPVAKLSGGNIQKVLLAREMAPGSRLVVLNKPTYGLDLQNTKRARDWIRTGAGAGGAAVIVISNELDELIDVCHRIAVMERGRIAGIVDNRAGAEADIGRLMTGVEAAG